MGVSPEPSRRSRAFTPQEPGISKKAGAEGAGDGAAAEGGRSRRDADARKAVEEASRDLLVARRGIRRVTGLGGRWGLTEERGEEESVGEKAVMPIFLFWFAGW
ncbi:hypothetical protein GW17_00052939 [Ensete ventricosum]|nr:hypothetical protein GW17_00052939 [Ensete ventricosum]RZS28178.1 hypothetical protein BHM03_00061740 [Ensete ventricosum]